MLKGFLRQSRHVVTEENYRHSPFARHTALAGVRQRFVEDVPRPSFQLINYLPMFIHHRSLGFKGDYVRFLLFDKSIKRIQTPAFGYTVLPDNFITSIL